MWPFKLPAESNSKGKRSGKQQEINGKRPGKQRKNSVNINGNQSKPQERSRNTHLSKEERQIISELRSEGFTIRAIAEELGRSTKTIHGALKKQGLSSSAKPEGRGISSQSKSVGEDPEDSLSALLFQQMGPFLAEASGDYLRKNPEVVEQLLWGCLESTPPKRTLDDMVERRIGDSPELLRRMAEHRVMMTERNGQSELDIVERFIPMLFQFAERLNQGNWARVTQSAVGSGEVRKTIVQALALLKNQNVVPAGNAEDGKSGGANQPKGKPPTGLAPQDAPGELSPAASPTYLPDPETEKEGFLNSAITWSHNQANLKGVRNDFSRQWLKKLDPGVLAARIREPLPDMTAELAEIKNSPGKLSSAATPTYLRAPGTQTEGFLNCAITLAHS